MNERPIYITTEDRAKLSLLLSGLGATARGNAVQTLREEVDRAVVLEPSAMPANVVTMNSEFEIEDLTTSEVDRYTLVFPERANVDQRMLSVLAPIGTAVLGYAEGNEVEWITPGGVRRLRIRRVIRPEVAAA